VDSVFRGNTFAEIAAWVKAFRDRLVVLAPAYPVLGRKVCQGRLTTSDLSGTHVVNLLTGLDVHLAGLECVSIESCADAKVLAGQMMQARASGRRLVLCDAVNDRELSCIVQAGISTGLDILWAGSGGLAHALSATLPKQRSIAPKPETPGPILFCIGSPHTATLQQMSYLKKTQGCVELFLSSTAASRLEKYLRAGRDVLLRMDRDPCDPQALADVLEPLSRKAAGALLLSGGDTAALACQALHVGAVALRGELLPGVPWGVIQGGPAQDLVVATKSGGFGPKQALAHAGFALTQARRAAG
jgi:D-threonate/D-erythronate kinase